MALDVIPAQAFEQELAARGRVIVAFVADWCGYCRRFLPALDEVVAGHPEQRFALADISDDQGDARWERYGIEVVPSVIEFVQGQPASRLDGVLGRGIDARTLKQWIGRQPR